MLAIGRPLDSHDESALTPRQVADNVAHVVASGSHSQRKVPIEVLIARIKITSPDRILPVSRIVSR